VTSAPVDDAAAVLAAAPALVAPGRRVLWLALAAALAASAWVATHNDEDVVPAVARPGGTAARPALTAPRSLTAAAPASAAGPVRWPRQVVREAGGTATVWAPLTEAARAAWLPSPVPAPPPAPAPVPAREGAPAFPFTVIGRWEQGAPERSFLLLQGPQRVYSVAAGEVLGSAWRLDRIDADAAQLTYLPLGVARTVNFPNP